MTVIRTAFVLLAALTLLGGCKKAEDAATSAAISAATGHKAKVDRDGNTVTITGDEGAVKISSGDNLSLPADFPKDVYLPAQYKVRSVMDMGPISAIQFSTSGDPTTLYSAARAAMQQQGWKESMAMQHAGGPSMAAFKKDKRRTTLTFNKRQDDVLVGVQLQREKQ